MPETPSIITSRASCSVSPTSATGDSLSPSDVANGVMPCVMPRTHSAPARVLPAPRPHSISQVVQERAILVRRKLVIVREKSEVARETFQIDGIKFHQQFLDFRRL